LGSDFSSVKNSVEINGGTAARLSRAAFPVIANMNLFNGGLDAVIHRDGVLEAVENFVGRILQPRIRLVQLARSLGGQLAKLIPIRDVRKCSKDQI
jgi:hypothetical protein